LSGHSLRDDVAYRNWTLSVQTFHVTETLDAAPDARDAALQTANHSVAALAVAVHTGRVFVVVELDLARIEQVEPSDSIRRARESDESRASWSSTPAVRNAHLESAANANLATATEQTMFSMSRGGVDIIKKSNCPMER